jgi:hypothetical protein
MKMERFASQFFTRQELIHSTLSRLQMSAGDRLLGIEAILLSVISNVE